MNTLRQEKVSLSGLPIKLVLHRELFQLRFDGRDKLGILRDPREICLMISDLTDLLREEVNGIEGSSRSQWLSGFIHVTIIADRAKGVSNVPHPHGTTLSRPREFDLVYTYRNSLYFY